MLYKTQINFYFRPLNSQSFGDSFPWCLRGTLGPLIFLGHQSTRVPSFLPTKTLHPAFSSVTWVSHSECGQTCAVSLCYSGFHLFQALLAILSLRALLPPKALCGRAFQVLSALGYSQSLCGLVTSLRLLPRTQYTGHFSLGFKSITHISSLPSPLRSPPKLGVYIFLWRGNFSFSLFTAFSSKASLSGDICLWIKRIHFKLDLNLWNQDVSKYFYYYCCYYIIIIILTTVLLFSTCNTTSLGQNFQIECIDRNKGGVKDN